MNAIQTGTTYTIFHKELDISNQTSYYFYNDATPIYNATEWVLVFTESGHDLRPLYSPQKVQTSSPIRSFTFIHLNSGEVVDCGSEPLGSTTWWRSQVCEAAHNLHLENPGGFWGPRYDQRLKARRPVRVLEHYATCSHRVGAQKEDGLEKLAKTILEIYPETKRRKWQVRNCE